MIDVDAIKRRVARISEAGVSSILKDGPWLCATINSLLADREELERRLGDYNGAMIGVAAARDEAQAELPAFRMEINSLRQRVQELEKELDGALLLLFPPCPVQIP